ncbi:RbsD/FucU family protein [Synoicihabitans lomoniglobus]|uniref:RbsD/FucU family protein n=1 Tax=Synoicihabitans lomoniglobus TaxID=2909285 RepID=A0AAF0CP78_9BACT|nr:RbsD/FucU family protein [Opitutaceae bacterium LMO-M01]WED65585.1 RbsD/FucU family protein [Opitutaceae bacterium LMO-M01]
MLNTRLIHPQILAALAASGHYSQVLVADGNFPIAGNRGPNAAIVHLNLAPGMVDAVSVLDALLTVVPVQAATVMEPPSDYAPEIHAIYQDKLGAHVAWSAMERWSFYEKIASPRTTLMIATGEQRRFANLLLEIGVVKLAAESF